MNVEGVIRNIIPVPGGGPNGETVVLTEVRFSCPKCGVNDRTCDVRGAGSSWLKVKYFGPEQTCHKAEGTVVEDHVHITCLRCGYQFIQLPLDGVVLQAQMTEKLKAAREGQLGILK